MRVMMGFIRQGIHVATSYSVAYWMQLLNVFIKMYAFYALWAVLYDQSPITFPVERRYMLAYGVVGVILGEVLGWWDGPHFYIVGQVRRGTITADLIRPVYFPFQVFSRCLGEKLAVFGMNVLPVAIIAYLTLPIALPPTWIHALAFCFSFALGYIIIFGTNFLVGILSFRTLNLWGIQHTYHGLMMMFSGMWIPLWFYPDWLRAVTDILPFRAVFFTPLAIYVGHTTGSALWLSIGQQTVWAIVLMGLCHITWVRTDRHLVVQGG